MIFAEKKKKLEIAGLFLTALATALIAPNLALAQDEQYIFPIIGGATYSNDFHASRADGPHHAIDIIANKGQPVVSVVSGEVTYVAYPQPSWGYAVFIEGDDGFEYSYIHLNNDSPGTDDGAGGEMRAYAPYMKRGNRVIKGQHIGYVGDSGNAENTVSHLHFEVTDSNNNIYNPYLRLNAALRISTPLLQQPLAGEVLPFGRSYYDGFSVEMGNFDDDGSSEYVVGSGPGTATKVIVYDEDNKAVSSFPVYAGNFGINLGKADVDGDGVDEILTGPGRGSRPLVKIHKADGTQVGRFYAYTDANNMGVLVAGGDIDGDGIDEIITSLAAGGVPLIKIYKLNGALVDKFFAYGETTEFGTDISSGDISGDISDEIVTVPLKGGVPKMKIFNGDTSLNRQMYVYSSVFLGGVRLSVGDVRQDRPYDEIVTVPASSAAQHLKIYTGEGDYIGSEKFLEEWWRGYYDVGAGTGLTKAMTGINRRVSVNDGMK